MKVIFDYALAILLLPVLFPVILLLILIATIDTSQFGLFTQKRIGQNAIPFSIFKIRTMKGRYDSDVTSNKTHHITKIGAFIRKTKMDEFPQIFNILMGDMSFVGPRPDVAGYADLLKNEDRLILKLKPGITGPAQLAFKNEDQILNLQNDPLKYNDEVLWPQKVAINLEYVKNWNFSKDLYYIWKTIF